MQETLIRWMTALDIPMGDLKPVPYGSFHMIWLFAGLAVSITAAILLRKVGRKGFDRVLLSCGLFLIATEIVKQALHIWGYQEYGTYKWWVFPFQLCSVPMYLCVIIPMLKDGPVRRGMINFLFYVNMFGGIMAYIEPSGIISSDWFLTLHSFTWHMMLIFIGLFVVINGQAGLYLRDWLTSCITFVGLAAVAFLINWTFMDVSDGGIQMFFVGPTDNSLVVFSDICAKYGWPVSTLIYIPSLCTATLAIWAMARLVRALRVKLGRAEPLPKPTESPWNKAAVIAAICGITVTTAFACNYLFNPGFLDAPGLKLFTGGEPAVTESGTVEPEGVNDTGMDQPENDTEGNESE